MYNPGGIVARLTPLQNLLRNSVLRGMYCVNGQAAGGGSGMVKSMYRTVFGGKIVDLLAWFDQVECNSVDLSRLSGFMQTQ